MAHDVFISYSSEDQKIVEGLSAYLEQNGIRCFIAYRDIPKGTDWAETIANAIEKCRLMIVVFSEHFNHSVQVNREITLAFEENKPILTFKIQDATFTGTKKYYLQNLNWIDAFPHPENHFGKLCEDILNLLPEIRLRKKETVMDPAPKAEDSPWEVSNKPIMSKKDFGLMWFLSFWGIIVFPLAGGLLLGALYGILHAIVGINKNIVGIVKATGITTFGLVWFSLQLFVNIILFAAIGKSEYRTVFVYTGTALVGIFGCIYSIVWIMKLNTLATKQGYDVKEIKKQFVKENKRTIIKGIIGFIVLLVIIIQLKF